jgi:hypothetical protein
VGDLKGGLHWLPNKQTQKNPYVGQYSGIGSKYKPEKLVGLNGPMHYFYLLGNGNNSNLVKKVLDVRPWWKDQVPCNLNSFNLRWTQCSVPTKYENQCPGPVNFSIASKQIYNHIEHNYEITSKSSLCNNMITYCQVIFCPIIIFQGNGIDPWSLMPLTYTFDMYDRSFDAELQDFAKLFLTFSNQTETGTFKAIKALNEDNFKKGIDLERMYFDFGLKRLRNKLKTSLGLNHKADTIKMSPELDQSKLLLGTKILSSTGRNLWILKPNDLNRGRGIELFTSLEELKIFITEYQCGYQTKNYSQFQIQKKTNEGDMIIEDLIPNEPTDYQSMELDPTPALGDIQKSGQLPENSQSVDIEHTVSENNLKADPNTLIIKTAHNGDLFTKSSTPTELPTTEEPTPTNTLSKNLGSKKSFSQANIKVSAMQKAGSNSGSKPGLNITNVPNQIGMGKLRTENSKLQHGFTSPSKRTVNIFFDGK